MKSSKVTSGNPLHSKQQLTMERKSNMSSESPVPLENNEHSKNIQKTFNIPVRSVKLFIFKLKSLWTKMSRLFASNCLDKTRRCPAAIGTVFCCCAFEQHHPLKCWRFIKHLHLKRVEESLSSIRYG